MKHFCQFRNFFFSTLSLKVWSFTTHFPQTLVWNYHSSTEVWSLSIKVWSFFIPHSVYTITTHFLCHYKLSHCLPTYVTGSGKSRLKSQMIKKQKLASKSFRC